MSLLALAVQGARVRNGGSLVTSAFVRRKAAAGIDVHIAWFLLLVHLVEVSRTEAIL